MSTRLGRSSLLLVLAAGLGACERPGASGASGGVPTVPDRVVVLTFDDSVRSHYTVARPLLKRYGFGATFFVTEAFSFRTDKEDYMTWEEIAELHRDGFEIGNHTANHEPLADDAVERLDEELRVVDERCLEHGIPRPVSFGWPGNLISDEGFAALARTGLRYGRRGGRPERTPESGRGPAYDPAVDDPLLIPSNAIPVPGWTVEDLIAAAEEARDGHIAVIQFHGVPEGEHPAVSTPREVFEAFLAYLHEEDYTVLALRDVERWIDREALPADGLATIRQRLASTSATGAGPDAR